MTFQEFLQDISPEVNYPDEDDDYGKAAYAGSEVDVRSYSGRGMYGRSCLGVVCSLQLLLDIVFEFGKTGEEFNLGSVKSDSMGCDTIYYWPDIPFDESLTSDGDPDGLREYEDDASGLGYR